MQITNIKSRGVLFTYNNPGWDLNLYLIKGEKYNYIIDTGLGTLTANPIKEYLREDPKETIIINTHYHWDHVWGNGSFKNHKIISHKACKELIQLNWETMLQKSGQFRQGEVELYLPNIVFDQELYFAEDNIRLFHTPGHTADSISILDERDKVIYLGDNVGDSMEELIPSIYCEKDVYINTMRNYEKLDFDTCISGHNIVLSKDVIGQILSML